MAKYRMDDGLVVNVETAVQSWREATDWNGNNYISRATGSQWDHEKLYRTRKGRYFIESWSQWQGSLPSARWATKETAAQWLYINDHSIPDDLQSALDAIEG